MANRVSRGFPTTDAGPAPAEHLGSDDPGEGMCRPQAYTSLSRMVLVASCPLCLCRRSGGLFHTTLAVHGSSVAGILIVRSRVEAESRVSHVVIGGARLRVSYIVS
jgi:hypothetical protein